MMTDGSATSGEASWAHCRTSWAASVQHYSVHLSGFEGLVLYDAIERESRLLELVTAEAREARDRDGWALARIKVATLRGILQQVVRPLPHARPRGYAVPAEEAEELKLRVAEVGQRMQPPKAELEEQQTLRARKLAARALLEGVEQAQEGQVKLPTSGLMHWAPPVCR